MGFKEYFLHQENHQNPYDESNFANFGYYGPKDFSGDVSSAVRYVVREFGLTPREIGSGNCDEFAFALVDIIGGEILATDDESDLLSHYFVKHKGEIL